jgi:hypothetical protein
MSWDAAICAFIACLHGSERGLRVLTAGSFKDAYAGAMHVAVLVRLRIAY